jgi:outer membrane protein TolC
MPVDVPAPLEPATRTLESWTQAKQWLRAHHPTLQQQQAVLLHANAQVTQAVSRMLPHLDVGAGTDYSLVRPTFVAYDRPAEHQFFDQRSLVPNGNAALTLTFSLSALRSIASAGHGVDAEKLTLAATQHALIGTLAATVLGVLGAERVATRNQAGLEAAAERMRLTERLAALGRATALDTWRFAQDLGETRSRVVSANEALSEAREALGNALGLPDAVRLADTFDISQLLTAQSAGCHSVARLAERADLRAADARIQRAEGAADAARLAYLPEIRLGSQYLGTYAPTSAITYEGQRGLLHNWSASANLVWSLFDGGARAADVSAAEADLRSARSAQTASQISAHFEQRKAQRLLQVARANLTIAQQNLAAARNVDGLSHKALELGHASALEVIDAARNLRAVEIAHAVSEVELLAAMLRQQLVLAVCE